MRTDIVHKSHSVQVYFNESSGYELPGAFEKQTVPREVLNEMSGFIGARLPEFKELLTGTPKKLEISLRPKERPAIQLLASTFDTLPGNRAFSVLMEKDGEIGTTSHLRAMVSRRFPEEIPDISISVAATYDDYFAEPPKAVIINLSDLSDDKSAPTACIQLEAGQFYDPALEAPSQGLLKAAERSDWHYVNSHCAYKGDMQAINARLKEIFPDISISKLQKSTYYAWQVAKALEKVVQEKRSRAADGQIRLDM